jgi:hypothetical protein
MQALACLATLACAASASAAVPWSPPASLSGCAAATTDPFIAFPGNSPTASTGNGGIVWGAGAGACLAQVGPSGSPGGAAALTVAAPAQLAGTATGQLAVAGDGRAGGVLVESPGSSGPLGGEARPSAEATAYLGDVAIASASGPSIYVRRQRSYEHRFGPPVLVATAPAPVTQLAVNLDYRTDTVFAWVAGGSIWAREILASGAARPVQRLGVAAPATRISALISDDGRAIVAWSRERGEPGGTMEGRVYLDVSAPGVTFNAHSTLIDSFQEPPGLPPPPGSVRLLRLSGESVRLAWTGMQSGRYVVRMAPISIAGLRQPVVTFADAWRDAVLSDFAAGPRGDALLLWSLMPRQPGAPGFVTAAREIDAAGLGGVREVVAPAAANGVPQAAFQQSTDEAVAVWRGPDGLVRYSVRNPVAAAGSSFPAARRSAVLLALAALEQRHT